MGNLIISLAEEKKKKGPDWKSQQTNGSEMREFSKGELGVSYQKKKAVDWGRETLYYILHFACISDLSLVQTQEMLALYKREEGMSLNLQNLYRIQRQLWVPP